MAVIFKGNQYMAERGSFYQGSVKIDGDFLVGPRATFWKNLVVTGNLYLSPDCQVKGNITCQGGVISRGCIIDGDLTATSGPLTLCDQASVHKVICNGDVFIRPGVSAGEIYGDTIIVLGKISCGKLLGKKTRVLRRE